MYAVHTILFKKSIIYWVKMTKSVFLTLISSFYSANNPLVINTIINNIITVIRAKLKNWTIKIKIVGHNTIESTESITCIIHNAMLFSDGQ